MDSATGRLWVLLKSICMHARPGTCMDFIQQAFAEHQLHAPHLLGDMENTRRRDIDLCCTKETYSLVGELIALVPTSHLSPCRLPEPCLQTVNLIISLSKKLHAPAHTHTNVYRVKSKPLNVAFKALSDPGPASLLPLPTPLNATLSLT